MNKPKTPFQLFLEKIGDESAADLFGFTRRAVMAYRHGARKPKRSHADVIVQRSKLSYDDIYGEGA